MTRTGSIGAPDRHLDDGALVRRLDGELEPGEAVAVEAHLADCDRCRIAMDSIAALSARFSHALPLVDAAPAPGVVRVRRVTPWQASPIWRVAAAIAFVAGLALAIAPVRAWVAEWLGMGGGRTAAESADPPDTPGPAPDRGGVRVAFVPTGEEFRVLVTAPQEEGELRLESAPGDTATGEVVGAADADLLVLPDGLGIRNDPFSTGDYRVVVPRDLARVEVRVAGRVAWSGSPEALPRGGERIDLSPDDERSSDR
ncbi:MAG TPA: zf-HC2 domain-containing protein [Gemmatimonadota bacterium]|nr:zf-HC2 domain-containing protein [Gemmatimonadota bacterium]